ncbi:MAG: DUF1801 domain-containing protein [Ilumatobacter sp.]|uniref:DUF1801 domain-containing protein n=1 Tax=Ilumatobacter sp. TaxID=1967498 RepID=UPI0026131FD7|nr:DUF1801 domain-containing protein [Ilumatobacter sp.]MDJ0771381.1 DUF1801 domain-containing protein [Ilumatobacter sp.]
MKIDTDTIDGLFAAAGDREADLREIDRLVTEAAPELDRRLFRSPSITMIGYGEVPGDHATEPGWWPVVGLTVQKRHLALYVSAERDGVTIAEHYRDRLGRTSNGKSCIRFSRAANVDAEQLTAAVRDAVAWSGA